VINGKTVPVDYNNFVLGPVSAAAGEFWRDALSYLIITGSLACAAALTNAGLRYMYAMGREGLLPRYLGKTHPVHKSPYTAVLTWGAGAVVLFLIFRITNHTGLDAYFWLSPQGVIWIVLVQALTALSVYMYFRREHPSEQSWKTTVCAWIGFAGQIFVLALFYHFETFIAFGSSIYVKELFTIGSGTFSVPVSWLGIIGVAVPVISLGYAYTIRAQNPEKYALMGRFVNESA
jgi:amino acid transporter